MGNPANIDGKHAISFMVGIFLHDEGREREEEGEGPGSHLAGHLAQNVPGHNPAWLHATVMFRSGLEALRRKDAGSLDRIQKLHDQLRPRDKTQAHDSSPAPSSE